MARCPLVIPSDWTPVHRADGEQVGWLAPDGGPGLVQPLLLTGAALADARGREQAVALLRARGLSALDRRWWARLPDTPLAGVQPVDRPEPAWDWHPVLLVEVSPAGATVRPEFAGPGDTGRASLPLPVGDLLRAEPPA
jgi:hypothetical protein